MKSSPVQFHRGWPPGPLNPRSTLLIFDQRLAKKAGPWIRKFQLRYPVKSGESLKDLSILPKHLEKILKRVHGIPRDELRVWVLGGGSVGDFGGFVASILYRGVPVVQVPSTWLAAIDSAHGGKTALNVGAAKNQIGTYHFAEAIHISKKILEQQPAERLRDARGELVKIAFLQGGSFWKKLAATDLTEKDVTELLPWAVQAKWKIVSEDPFEEKGLRHLLNLGHTLGHVIESQRAISHGWAVALGMEFDLRWTDHLGQLPRQDRAVFRRWQELGVWPRARDVSKHLRKIKQLKTHLQKDKKTTGSEQLRYALPFGAGRVVLQKLTLGQILREAERQSFDETV